MKKFTENNVETTHYAADMKLYNELYEMINDSLYATVDNDINEKASLIGKDDLVKELSKLVENEIIKTKISVLENYRKNPTIVQERIEFVDPYLQLVNEAKKCDCDKQKDIKKCDCDKPEKCEKCGEEKCDCETKKIEENNSKHICHECGDEFNKELEICPNCKTKIGSSWDTFKDEIEDEIEMDYQNKIKEILKNSQE